MDLLEQRRKDAQALAAESTLTVPEAEALIVACLGDVDRARRAMLGAQVVAAVKAELALKHGAQR